MFPNRYGEFLRDVLRHTDIVLLFFYIGFRHELLTFLLTIFDVITQGHGGERFKFLIFGGVIFFVCVLCSYARYKSTHTVLNRSRGIIFFELMILFAVALVVAKNLTRAEVVDPFWIVNISFGSYIFEILTAAGSGYVAGNLLLRIRLSFKR